MEAQTTPAIQKYRNTHEYKKKSTLYKVIRQRNTCTIKSELSKLSEYQKLEKYGIEIDDAKLLLHL